MNTGRATHCPRCNARLGTPRGCGHRIGSTACQLRVAKNRVACVTEIAQEALQGQRLIYIAHVKLAMSWHAGPAEKRKIIDARDEANKRIDGLLKSLGEGTWWPDSREAELKTLRARLERYEGGK